MADTINLADHPEITARADASIPWACMTPDNHQNCEQAMDAADSATPTPTSLRPTARTTGAQPTVTVEFDRLDANGTLWLKPEDPTVAEEWGEPEDPTTAEKTDSDGNETTPAAAPTIVRRVARSTPKQELDAQNAPTATTPTTTSLPSATTTRPQLPPPTQTVVFGYWDDNGNAVLETEHDKAIEDARAEKEAAEAQAKEMKMLCGPVDCPWPDSGLEDGVEGKVHPIDGNPVLEPEATNSTENESTTAPTSDTLLPRELCQDGEMVRQSRV
jgi:hypothetical protein